MNAADPSRGSEIVELEQRFWQAIADNDIDAASGLMAERAIVAGAQGIAAIDRDAFARMMREGRWTLRGFEFDRVEVQFAGDDVAMIGYEVTEDLLIDGKPRTVVAYDASVWRRDGGAWQCVLHTESIKGDPFRAHAG